MTDGTPTRADAEDLAQGVGRLVVGLVDTLRMVMEAQALRRFENGDLSADEERRLGAALQRLAETMPELRELFGLDPDAEAALMLGEIDGTRIDLADALDRVVSTGLVVRGGAALTLADVALAELDLALHLRTAKTRAAADPVLPPARPAPAKDDR